MPITGGCFERGRFALWLAVSLSAWGSPARSQIFAVAVGRQPPGGFRVAPGQIVGVFAHGIKVPEGGVSADRAHAPTTLAGVSVTLRYSLSGTALPAPILRIEATPSGLAAVTVQIPFELKYPSMLASTLPGSDHDGPPDLIISQSGDAAPPVRLAVGPDNIDLKRACDGPRAVAGEPSGPKCARVVFTHADGTRVGYDGPAVPGEIVAVQAYGLGNTNAGMRTGDPTPSDTSAAEFSHLFRTCFEFAGAKNPLHPPCFAAVSAGLLPGSIGLYEIRFAVPDLPEGTPDCTQATDFSADNVTITIEGPTSQDRASLCVQRAGERRPRQGQVIELHPGANPAP